MLRVVLDANVVVSGFITPGGTCGRILSLVSRGGSFRTVLSTSIAREYRRSLLYPKVRRRHGRTEAEVDEFVKAISFHSDLVPGTLDLKVVKADPDDDKYIVAAVEGMADHVVSGDTDLLDIGFHKDIYILSPALFMRLLERGAGA